MEKKNDIHENQIPKIPSRPKPIIFAAVLAGLILLVIATVVFGVFGRTTGSSGTESDNDFASMVPIYIAILGGAIIPQIAMRKKQAQVEGSKEKLFVIGLALGLVILGLAVMILFMLLS